MKSTLVFAILALIFALCIQSATASHVKPQKAASNLRSLSSWGSSSYRSYRSYYKPPNYDISFDWFNKVIKFHMDLYDKLKKNVHNLIGELKKTGKLVSEEAKIATAIFEHVAQLSPLGRKILETVRDIKRKLRSIIVNRPNKAELVSQANFYGKIVKHETEKLAIKAIESEQSQALMKKGKEKLELAQKQVENLSDKAKEYWEKLAPLEKLKKAGERVGEVAVYGGENALEFSTPIAKKLWELALYTETLPRKLKIYLREKSIESYIKLVRDHPKQRKKYEEFNVNESGTFKKATNLIPEIKKKLPIAIAALNKIRKKYDMPPKVFDLNFD